MAARRVALRDAVTFFFLPVVRAAARGGAGVGVGGAAAGALVEPAFFFPAGFFLAVDFLPAGFFLEAGFFAAFADVVGVSDAADAFFFFFVVAASLPAAEPVAAAPFLLEVRAGAFFFPDLANVRLR